MNETLVDGFDQSTFEKFLSLIHETTGITMAIHKKAMVEGRIRPRLRQLGIKTYSEYFNFLFQSSNEMQIFVDIITTNETSFFRTQRVWEYFQKEFLFDWTKSSTNPLKIWSAASSTGEEVYSIAMSCEEHKLNFPKFNYEIVGSDISNRVLKTATDARYTGRSIDNFKKNHLKFFEKYMRSVSQEGHFEVSQGLKSKVSFFKQNLFEPISTKTKFDIIFLRNVLIYFVESDQEKVLKNISNALADNGILIVGESESLSRLKSDFNYKSPLVYQKRA